MSLIAAYKNRNWLRKFEMSHMRSLDVSSPSPGRQENRSDIIGIAGRARERESDDKLG